MGTSCKSRRSIIINEYNIIADENDRRNFYDIVKSLRDMGTPISGLGIQAHEPNKGRYYYSPQQIWDTFEKYNSFGLPMHITELSQVANGDAFEGTYKTGKWTEEEQARFAEMIYTLAFGYPGIVSVNWWGFSDANIWQPKAGLVDENLQPKPVYNTLDRLINHEWKTSVSDLKAKSNGKINFRGFKGNYKITVKKNGQILKTVPLIYIEGEKNEVTIDL